MSDAFDRTEGLMSIQKLKERFLLGINLTLDNGTPYPDAFFEYCILSAASVLEHELDIDITPRDRVENVDFRSPNYMNWNFVQLDHYPIIEVKKWEVIFPANQTLFEYPIEWIRIDGDKGILQLYPDQGNIPQWMVNASFMPMLFTGHSMLPHFYKITYVSGFPNEGIPIALNEAMGLIASMLPLDTAGDLIAGAGIANYSISIDGASQSIGTTSSATNAGYGARILSYQGRLKKLMQALQDYYKGIIFDSI